MAGKELILRNLKQRGFEPYYFETREEALKKLLEMIPSDRTIGFGGSMTLEALNVKEMLLERGNSVYDRAKAETPEEAQEIMRNALLSDV
ncbi:MAG: lactate utilization protein, partial [Clostridia bacterium]|nr:lactate utilization protein [Clostridia bacterium]